MNWMMTKPHEKVVFEKGEPICQLFPYPKEYIEHFKPVIRTKSSMPSELNKAYEYYVHSRDVFNKSPREVNSWEANYFKGQIHDGTNVEDLGRKHYTSIKTPKWVTESSNGSYQSD